MTLTSPDPRLTPQPPPPGRGRWRLTAYQRQFSTAQPAAIAELINARGRRLSQKWNAPADLTFTLDGHDPEAALILELATDVVATRWNEYANNGAGADEVLFRGLVDHSEDQLSEQSATVTFTVHDYFALLGRRINRAPITYTGVDQDTWVNILLQNATSSVTFQPGNFLPLSPAFVDPAGVSRGASGVTRDRTYPPGTVIGQAIDDLAKVQSGFDYAVLAAGPAWPYDSLAVYYPQQGITRTDVALVYGVNVNAVTRTVSSGDYANYVRVIGNKASADPNAPQLFSEAWNSDANNITVNPIGLFMQVDNASDVTVQSTLDQQAAGTLAWAGALTPAYTVTIRPGTWRRGYPNMGDTVPLVVREGRLNVNTTVRVLGIEYSIGDDGQEDVQLTVGRTPQTLARILTAAQRNIDQLARR